MVRYAEDFLAALRQRYEQTDQPMRSLAREFSIGISTLSSLVERHGWVKRSQRRHGRPEASLVSEAQALMESLQTRTGVVADNGLAFPLEAPPTPDPSPPRAARVEGGEQTAAERIEALLLKEIAAEEVAREALGNEPRLRTEADACARRLAVMTQTLQTLQKIREAQPMANARCQCSEYDDLPDDLDALRDELARRIEAFMETHTDEELEADLARARQAHESKSA
ncbi:hypothetical protein DW352_25355 [Pseudolabrys taiwanensis]|uniref:Uncharacterized protein n=2 Tax=Pseudolabrys taiwanensis TaxID=331696 RepID=A0A346A312_9HYPH|nr:hypothetical protein DW352_25355 [Pseudolabrys taiwanensis]